jgi:hypothetical protein
LGSKKRRQIVILIKAEKQLKDNRTRNQESRTKNQEPRIKIKDKAAKESEETEF